jgi:hypothetical protein
VPAGNAPPGRLRSAGFYDPATNRLIVFSGLGAKGNLNDVWVLENANGIAGTAQWINLLPGGVSGTPAPRWGASAVYDPGSNRMITFGGCLGSSFPVSNEVWVLTNANGTGGPSSWIQLFPNGPGPNARAACVTVYDSANNRLTVFGGQNGSGFGCSTYGDVWVLTNANGTAGTPSWTQITPSDAPPQGQFGAAGAYDSATNRMIVSGGTGLTGTKCIQASGVWALTNANGIGGAPAWMNLTSEENGAAPSGRAFHSAVYDPATNQMKVFGGEGRAGILGDTWTLVNANGVYGVPSWIQDLTSGGPPLRTGHLAVLDPSGPRMIVFGGQDGGPVLNDTWVLGPAAGPAYNISLLYDRNKAVRGGGVISIRLKVTSISGHNVASASLTLHAIGTVMTWGVITGPIEVAVLRDPDIDFGYDPKVGNGGYVFNLKTTSLSTGTYQLLFTVGSDPNTYRVPFQVK